MPYLSTQFVTFFREDGSKVQVSKAAIEILLNHRQLGPNDNEAGGVLLGRLLDDSNDVIIDEVTVPGEQDKRTRFSFLRSRCRTQSYVNHAWSTSGHTKIYLGEWHTHPEDNPTPSRHDLDNWRKISRFAKYEQDSLFFSIVGLKDIRMWEFEKGRDAATELRPQPG